MGKWGPGSAWDRWRLHRRSCRIAALDEFKGAWRAIGRIAPEPLGPAPRPESIGSSTRIEGAALNDREVERLLANLDVRAFASRDEEEVAGYAAVMETVFERRTPSTSPRTTSGYTATCSSSRVGTNVIAEPGRPSPTTSRQSDPTREPRYRIRDRDSVRHASTDARARRLDAGRLSRQGLHPLIVIAVFVVVFLEIHPFQDGNGRLSRERRCFGPDTRTFPTARESVHGQGGLLPRASPDASHHPIERARLDALVDSRSDSNRCTRSSNENAFSSIACRNSRFACSIWAASTAGSPSRWRSS